MAVPHWTKPEGVVFAWVLGALALFIYYLEFQQGKVPEVVQNFLLHAMLAFFFVFVGTEAYLNRKEAD
jgi:uncharacterized membrane protein